MKYLIITLLLTYAGLSHPAYSHPIPTLTDREVYCGHFVSDWTVKCADFGPFPMTDEAKSLRVDKCEALVSDVFGRYLKGIDLNRAPVDSITPLLDAQDLMFHTCLRSGINSKKTT